MFGAFLMFIAISIAGVAAYFSVYGLAHIFAGAFWSVVIMGGVLEIGKLVATSFVYRYWDVLKWTLRTYLLAAIAGLMILTSAGIFGYLSNSYQQDIVGVKDVGSRIELLDTELASLSDREKQINDDIGRIGSNFVTARQNMMKQYGPEKDKLTKRIAEIRAERLELSTKQLEVEAHTGPIIYIAKAMNKGVDEAVMWMICLIIFVFDPLAVALTIGANIALTAKRPEPEKAPVVQPDPDPQLLEELAKTRLDLAAVKDERDALANRPDPEPIVQVKEVVVPAEIPEGHQLVDAQHYNALKQVAREAADDLDNLETELSQKQETVDLLVEDYQRLEDELFALLDMFEKKETQIAQLKDAIRATEEQQELPDDVMPLALSAKERAALHQRNQVAAKQQ